VAVAVVENDAWVRAVAAASEDCCCCLEVISVFLAVEEEPDVCSIFLCVV